MLYNKYTKSQWFEMWNKNHQDLALFKEVLVSVLSCMLLGLYVFLEGILKNGKSKSFVIKITYSHQWKNKSNMIIEEESKVFVSLYLLFGNEKQTLSSDLLWAQGTWCSQLNEII